ncbi:hypothetical protein TorRG33x02_274500 [Trema orientale]|uniref:Uncharacterized protein n=1 Tax=Trema orientale TaxID=63057 RepID=A0A2P5CSR2_TREOI|nr:hypothetical protein TorRG33x02_274500 [Trema orientale]
MCWGDPRLPDNGSATPSNGVASKISEFATRMVRAGSDEAPHAGHDREAGHAQDSDWVWSRERDVERVLRESAAEAAVIRVAPADKAAVEAMEEFTYTTTSFSFSQVTW